MTAPDRTDPTCFSHHYLSGWMCQLNDGHDGPHICEAFGQPATPETPWYHIWNHTRGEPACNQMPAEWPTRTAMTKAKNTSAEEMAYRIVELTEENARLTADVERLDRKAREYCEAMNAATDAYATTSALLEERTEERDAAKQDTERLDWLESHLLWFGTEPLTRAAIDRAIVPAPPIVRPDAATSSAPPPSSERAE